MQYRILLTNTWSREWTEIEIPSHATLEDLSVQIKLALQLPYNDHEWHRFQTNGITYMPERVICADDEVRGECELPALYYRSSENVRLSQVFTTLNSAISYRQDWVHFTVRCTLLERW